MATEIERPQTSAERADFTRLGTKMPRDIFLKELAIVEHSFAKKKLPFDSQCAKADFNDEIEKLERESERSNGFVRAEDISKFKFKDFEKYGDKKRFDIVKTDEDVETVNINGLRSSQKCGFTVQYRCKERRHGISVCLTTAEYEEQFGDKKTMTEE